MVSGKYDNRGHMGPQQRILTSSNEGGGIPSIITPSRESDEQSDHGEENRFESHLDSGNKDNPKNNNTTPRW